MDINVKDCIIPMYDDVLLDILRHNHTHYVFPGGRGSTKSSFVGGISIPLLIMAKPKIHAVCFRKENHAREGIFDPRLRPILYPHGVKTLLFCIRTGRKPYFPICLGLIYLMAFASLPGLLGGGPPKAPRPGSRCQYPWNRGSAAAEEAAQAGLLGA